MLDTQTIRMLKKSMEENIASVMKNFEIVTGIEIKGLAIDRGSLTAPGKGPISRVVLRCGEKYELDW